MPRGGFADVPRPGPRRAAAGPLGRAAVGWLVGLSAASCVRPPRMCVSEAECGALSSCVAGRCLLHGTVPAIAAARRVLYAPVDVAYVRPGDPSDEGLAIAALGGDRGALLIVRFAVALPPEASVLEAYLRLERATEVDDDPVPIALHAARVTQPWDSASVSWARQPHVEEVGSPVTRVLPGSGPIVRLDVRSLVLGWRRRASDEFGLAIVAEGKSTTGISVALAPGLDPARPVSQVDPALADLDGEGARAAGGGPRAALSTGSRSSRVRGSALAGPELELYVK